MTYEYKAELRRVVDGDTIDVDIDLGFNHWIRGERIRLLGVDCPESRTSNKVEKRFGLLAKAFVQKFLEGKQIILKTSEKGKYGRYLGDFKVGTKWLTKELLKNYHAVEYTGQNKKLVKAAHLKNRQCISG